MSLRFPTRLSIHSKGLPYRRIGTAKHSETLEDLVVYECLYPNETAKMWARPQAMFEESVITDGTVRPRFRTIDVEITEAAGSFASLPETMVLETAGLMRQVFGDNSAGLDRLSQRLNQKNSVHLLVARLENKPVGFKLGYEESVGCFYSWLGGVHTSARGLGVARALMEQQHHRCRSKGYQLIRTKTKNRFPEMLIFNIKAGFRVVGLEAADSDDPKIVMEKKLASGTEVESP
jgi:GNAT superfamily N-acetyltransferase